MNGTSVPAGFWIRVAAALIDGIIFIPFGVLLLMDLLLWKNFFLVVLLSIPSLIYKPLMESFKGATLGKMACNLRVIDASGNNLALGPAFLRSSPNLMALFVGIMGYALLFSNRDFLEAKTFMDFIQIRQSDSLSTASLVVECFVLIDCITVAFTAHNRAIHDFLANSYCVRVTGSSTPTSPSSDNAFFCSNCNNEIPHDAKFCPHCGTPFHEE